jgi:hypothetical protein
MAGSSKAGSSSHATESLAERFDHAAANNQLNSEALKDLKENAPTAFKLSLQIQMESYSVSLEPTPTSPALYIDIDTGVWSCRCARMSASTFAEYMLDPANRDASGFLILPGGSGKSQGGYFGYGSLTVPLDSQLQSIRTLSAPSVTDAQDLVRSLPGLLPLLKDVLRHLARGVLEADDGSAYNPGIVALPNGNLQAEGGGVAEELGLPECPSVIISRC